MRRGVLINRSHHQLTLVNSILGRQPLVARLTRHQQLPQALGLPGLRGLPGLPVSQAHPVSPTLAGPVPSFPIAKKNFRTALPIQPENDGDAKVEAPPVTTQVYEESIPVQPSTEMIAQAEQRVVDQPSLPEQQAEAKVEVTVPAREPVKVMSGDEAVPEDNVVDEAIAQGVERGNVPERVAEDATKVEAAEILTVQTKREAEPEVETLAEREDIREIEVEAEPESFTEQEEDARRPANQSATGVDAVQPLPEDGHGSTGEAEQSRQYDDTIRQVERLATDEAVPERVGEGAKSPVETVKPRRPRRSIEELTAQAGHRSPPATPTKKEPQEPRRNVQLSKAERQPGPKSTGENEIQADELFAPSNTDRSPQAWLARLMGKSIPAQEEVAPDTGMGQDLPVESGGSEAPTDERPSLSLSQQRNEQRQEVKAQPSPSLEGNQEVRRGDAISPSVAQPERDVSERRASSIPAFPSQRSGEQGPAVKGQRQKQVEKTNALLTVPGKPGMVKAANTVQARQPEQLSSRTRRFLRPLLGIDPAGVQVHRDAQAAQLADAYRADAVTVGDAVELPTSNASETPETLGLLAHEFTHVARQREPGFVPPILQSQQNMRDGSGASIVGPTPRVGLGRVGGLEVTSDEEALALQVERQVRQVAGMGAASIVGPPLAGGQSGRLSEPGGTIIPPAQDTVSPLPAVPFAPTEPVETRRAANDPWGGLPAPWEPLPGWLTTTVPPTPTEQSVASAPASAPAPLPAPAAFPAQTMASNGSHQQANGNAEAVVQRAEIGRSIGEDAIPPASPAREARAPEPDLDELARQVYSILRNRLEVERRRHR